MKKILPAVLLGLALSSPATNALAAKPKPAAAPERAVPFIADDYPKALAEARAKKLPIFIEAWAPW